MKECESKDQVLELRALNGLSKKHIKVGTAFCNYRSVTVWVSKKFGIGDQRFTMPLWVALQICGPSYQLFMNPAVKLSEAENYQ